MRTHFVRLLVLVALSLPATALAQGQSKPTPAKPTPAKPTPAKAAKASKALKPTGPHKVKQIDITEGDDVEGGIAGATGTDITVVGPVVHSSLLRLRMDFNDHVIRSADRL